MAKHANTALERRILSNTVEVLRLSNTVAREMLEQLAAVRETLLEKLEERGPTSFTKRRARQLVAEIDGTLLTARDQGVDTLTTARAAVIKKEFTTIAEALAADAKVAVKVDAKIPVRTLKKLIEAPLGGRTLGEWVGRAYGNVSKGVKDVLFGAAAKGEGVAKAASDIRDAFGLSRKASTTLTRTTLLQASNDARLEVYKENADLIQSYTYLATLDNRTCEVCAPWDGITEDSVDDLPEVPQHPSCRCTVRPNTRFAGVITRPAVVEVNERRVRHQDGSTSTKFTPEKVVATTMNFEGFFKGQPAAWQRDYLGGRRYEEFKAGKLTFDDLKRAAGVTPISMKAFAG